MTSLTLIFTLSAIGISETVYLIRKRISAQAPICPIGEGCATVLTSRWSKILIVPNDVMGFLAYIAIAVISALLLIEVEPMTLWDSALKILVGLASLASIFFTYLQAKVIKAWCFWCLMSASTIWLMAIIIIFGKI